MARTIGIGALAAVASLVSAAPAAALEEDAWLVSGGVRGVAHAASAGAQPGIGAGLELARGLDDVWSARAAVGADLARGAAPHGRDVTLALGVGAAYDVLRVVPFVDLAVVLAHRQRVGADGAVVAGAEAGVGAAYLVDAAWSLALALRGRALPVGRAANDRGGWAALVASLALGRTFD